jgi:hypothetical protein
VYFDTTAGEGLGAVAVEEATKSLKSARLEGWLSNLDGSSVKSNWRWSLSDECADAKNCSAVRELEWGEAALEKE